MKLIDYLTTKGISAAEFGRRIKVSQAAITRYAAGDRIPEPGIMRRITRITKGAVAPNDFYGVALPKTRSVPRLSPKAEQGRSQNRQAILEANGELARNGLGSKGVDLIQNRPGSRKPSRVAITAWNKWVDENGIPFAGLRPW